MPRHNNDGRTAKFLHTGGGGGGGFGGGGGGGGRSGGFQGQGGRKYNNDFKFTSQQHRGIQKRNRGPKPFQRFDETGDTVMGGDPVASSSNYRGGQGGGRRNRKNREWRNRLPNKHQDFIFGPTWHRVTILDGTSYSRDMVVSALVTASTVPFIPVAYSTSGMHTVFYVEDRTMAQALAECNGKINAAENKPMKLRIQPCNSPPTANFDLNCETKVRAELERRYNGPLNTISLSNFAMSPALIGEYYLPLNRASVVIKLLNLLEPMLNNLVGLDLANNKMANLEGFGHLPKKAPNLKALNLGKNKFREIGVLDKIHGMQIIELILEENPVCNNYTEQDRYISDVRRRFPKVTKLDGLDIPPPITFEVAEPIRMPEIKGSTYCNEQAKAVVLAFWQQFMTVYDSDDRKPLLQAYHENATMSMMASYSQQGHVSQMDPSKKLSGYLGDSRNLLRNPDKHRKHNLLHVGNTDITTFLQKLPKTTHDSTSCVIDMPVAVENFILFNVAGLFKEREERSTPIRYFSRTFAVVPLNGGYVIVNEMLFITTPTTNQIKGAFKSAPTVAPVPVLPPVADPSSGVISVAAAPAAVTPRVFTDAEKQAMLTSFAQQSGMNGDWSRKCLEQNNWDYDHSAFVFTQLKEQGKIPPEAFIK